MLHFKFWVQAAVITASWGLVRPIDAFSRTLQDTPYPAERVWSTAMRLLRVDLRFPILEKDKDALYILFDYQQDAKVYKGALELVAFEEPSGRAATRLAVSVPDLPRHVEAVLLEKLGHKLKEELGSPAPARPPRPSANKEGNKAAGDTTKNKASSEADPRRESEDPNQPVRGEDGLPRLPTRELPRAQQ